jgi:hypothetical protein
MGIMDDFKLYRDVNRVQIETVLADLELGLTFADRALGTDNPETCARNRANAREAYFKIHDEFLSRCSPDDSERARIDDKLRELRRRLKRLGESCD